MIICPRCGFSNPDNVPYCSRCNYPLMQQPYGQQLSTPQPPSPQPPYIPTQPYGEGLDGVFLSYSKQLQEGQIARRRKGVMLELVGIILTVVLAFIGALFNLAGVTLGVLGVIVIRIGRAFIISSRFPTGSISFGKRRGSVISFNDQGIYINRRLLSKWDNVADVQVTNMGGPNNMGSIKFILRSGRSKEVDVSQVPYPARLVEYLKKRYLNWGMGGSVPYR
ncbi:zinc-ribbon domain-containing protein [Stygiolobus caldivivus]|uniref:Zinc-ribbon domain-containing protein n=1 Tax=Stygiolobus caldivivus TaxID=2824673 RepID=A0A8D5ZJ75_9CREN|nr:zinc-ribbon domain-containing protein [Stygiolobus caldivivus]BCU69932.1 hypothetical protein KN1_12290 [Stygiolobus caldivivus]